MATGHAVTVLPYSTPVCGTEHFARLRPVCRGVAWDMTMYAGQYIYGAAGLNSCYLG